MWLTGLGLAVLAGMAAALLPVFREVARHPVLPLQQAPEGRMVRLRHGLTHIREDALDDTRVDKRADALVAVLVHGLSTPSFVFDGMVPALVARGYRVIRYDHYGRGRSDAPRIPQTAEVFRTHLSQVLETCRVDRPALFVGYSMGGAIVTDFAAHYPDRVTRLVLLAPVGMQNNVGGALRRLIMIPGLGDWLFQMVYPRLLRKGIAAERGLSGSVPNIADRQLAETRRRGFFRLVLASLRGLLATSQEPAHRRIAHDCLPVLAIFGAGDNLIPLAARDTLARWNPQATLMTLPDAGHGLTYTHTDAVLSAL